VYISVMLTGNADGARSRTTLGKKVLCL
jgi:hypothetical protein